MKITLNAPLLPAPDPEVGHWGGLFGVRESEELISGRTSGGSENNDSEAVDSQRRTTRKGTSLSGPHPTPWSPMWLRTPRLCIASASGNKLTHVFILDAFDHVPGVESNADHLMSLLA